MVFGRPGRRAICYGYEGIALANPAKSPIDNTGKKDCLTNLFRASLAKKNPDALTGATGATVLEKRDVSHTDDTPKPGRNAMSLYAKDAHKAVARMVGYALTLGDSDSYLALSDVLALRLTDQERAGLAYAALRALDTDNAENIAAAVLGWEVAA